MSKYVFNVSISPEEAYELIKQEEIAELIDEELVDFENGIYIGTLIFEKYYFRTSNRAALIVVVDNVNGKTRVKSIATGTSQGLIFNFDWGAADNFAGSVRDILAGFIIE